jgi:hypothetical protein
MPMTTAQIIARACSIAKVPGYSVQAGQYLNMTLSTLCQEYDFDYTQKTQEIPLTSAQAYNLNSDSLRTKEVFYNLGGIVFYLYQIPIETFNALPNVAGGAGSPDRFAVDVSTTPHRILFYPSPNISQTISVKYFPQKADIVTPESDITIPWFINQEYLLHRVAACLMLDTDDDRQQSFESAAERMLSKILTMVDDKEGYSQTIKLSKERFRSGQNSNPNKAFPFG